jgi:hypothetical protein
MTDDARVCRICRSAVSTSVIGSIVPITLSISFSSTVARLSVMITESVFSPLLTPIAVASEMAIRLG